MFKKNSVVIRGGFSIERTQDKGLYQEGLSCQVMTSQSDTEVNESTDEDLEVVATYTVYFRPDKDGWEKAYKRLRTDFPERFIEHDNNEMSIREQLRQKRFIKEYFKDLKQEGADHV